MPDSLLCKLKLLVYFLEPRFRGFLDLRLDGFSFPGELRGLFTLGLLHHVTALQFFFVYLKLYVFAVF